MGTLEFLSWVLFGLVTSPAMARRDAGAGQELNP